MTSFDLQGVLAVFQTPFGSDDAVDFATLEREIDWLFAEGADGIVMAMVSEVLRLSTDERQEVAARACRAAAGRGAVIISVGAESAHTMRSLAQHAEQHGAAAVMAIPPVATALGEAELRWYYEQLIEATALPVIVQDASNYVGRPMGIDLQASLRKTFGPRIMFKPEAAPLGPRLSQLREATGGDARIFEGSGGIALVESFQRGIAGTMPGADLVRPIVAIWRALKAGKLDWAQQAALPLAALVSIQTNLDAFLAVEKHLLVKQGVFVNERVRGPVGFHLDPFTRSEVDRLFDHLLALTGH